VPADPEQLRVWIDVLFIDQLSEDIAAALCISQELYASADFHLALSTETLLSRGWCLFEFAVRQNASKATMLVGDAGLVRPKQWMSEKESTSDLPDVDLGCHGGLG
jgi:hypothetical protein